MTGPLAFFHHSRDFALVLASTRAGRTGRARPCRWSFG